MIRIVQKSTLDKLKQDKEILNSIIDQKEIFIDVLSRDLKKARAENDRLFDLHNKRLTKPKPDKNGVLRDNNGRFAKK